MYDVKNKNGISYFIKRITSNKVFQLIVPIIHFLFATFVSRNYFIYSKLNYNNYDNNYLFYVTLFLVNIVFLISLFVFYHYLFKFINNIVRYKSSIKIFFIYFSIMFLFLLLTWPGVWRSDDIIVLYLAKRHQFFGWQNIFSSIFYIIALKLFPFGISVVILQIFVISWIVSYILTNIYDIFKIKTIFSKGLIFASFLLPPIIDNNLYPLRCIIYGYLLFVYLIVIYKYYNLSSLKWTHIFIMIFNVLMISFLRSEGIIFLATSLIIYIVFFVKKKISLSKFFCVILFPIAFFIPLFKINSLYMYKSLNQDDYNITATIDIIYPLIKKEYKTNGYSEILHSMDEVINVDMIISDETFYNGSSIFWNGLIKDYYVRKDYYNYFVNVAKLCFKYPKVFVETKFNNFLYTSSILDNQYGNSVCCTLDIFKPDYEHNILNYSNSYDPSIHPINQNVRNFVISLLEGKNLNNYYEMTLTAKLFWNLMPPIIAIIITMIGLLFLKKIFLFFLIFSIVIYFFVVFITAPCPLFMYYFGGYLIGYNIIFSLIAKLIDGRIIK